MAEKIINILISDELAEVLREIESDSLVANLLLKKTHLKDDLVDSPVNYISLSKTDKGRISYLTQDRIDSISEADENADHWGTTKRFSAKPGAFITKVFKDISPKEVEKFSNLLRAEITKPIFKFKIIEGDDIKKYYHYSTYSSDRGTLGVSCMKHEHCQRYFDLYTANPNKVKMLAMFNSDDFLIGRALIWNFESYKIMDRIYTNNDEELQFFFKKWATKNGYYYKTAQNWFNTLQFERLGEKQVEMQLEIELENFDFKFYPYMDTFKFISGNKLYNYMPKDVNVYTICASDGNKFDSNYLRFDGIDRVFRYRGDAIHLDYLDIYTSGSNVEWSNSNDKYILRTDGFYREDIHDFIFIEEKDHLNNKEAIEARLEMYKERNKQGKSNLSSIFGTYLDMNIAYDMPGIDAMRAGVRRGRADRVRVGNAPVEQVDVDQADMDQVVAGGDIETENQTENQPVNTVYGRNGRFFPNGGRGEQASFSIAQPIDNQPVQETVQDETQPVQETVQYTTQEGVVRLHPNNVNYNTQAENFTQVASFNTQEAYQRWVQHLYQATGIPARFHGRVENEPTEEAEAPTE